MNKGISLSSFLVASAFSCSVLAQPQIESVTIKSSAGGSSDLTITGSNFGGASPPWVLNRANSWTATDPDGNTISGTNDQFWEIQGSPWADPLAIVDQSAPITSSANKAYYGKQKSYDEYVKPFNGQSNSSIYVSWWFKPNSAPDGNGGSNKYIRIWDDHSGEATRISWTSQHLTYPVNTSSSDVSWAGWSGKLDQWNQMEIYVDDSKNLIKAWINGELVHNVSNFGKFPGGTGLNLKLIGFDPSVSSSYSNFEFYVDNIFISTSQARVVASQKATWNEAKNSHLTLLPKSWSSSKITVNSDLIENGKDYFIYVVDSNGDANSSGATLCSQCPSPVKLDVVVQ